MHSSGEFFSISKSNVTKIIYRTTVIDAAVQKNNSGMYTLAIYTYNTNQRRTATKLQQTRKGNWLLQEERKIIIYTDLSVLCKRGFVIRPTAGSIPIYKRNFTRTVLVIYMILRQKFHSFFLFLSPTKLSNGTAKQNAATVLPVNSSTRLQIVNMVIKATVTQQQARRHTGAVG